MEFDFRHNDLLHIFYTIRQPSQSVIPREFRNLFEIWKDAQNAWLPVTNDVLENGLEWCSRICAGGYIPTNPNNTIVMSQFPSLWKTDETVADPFRRPRRQMEDIADSDQIPKWTMNWFPSGDGRIITHFRFLNDHDAIKAKLIAY